MVVRVAGELRKPTLELLQGMEFHADNVGPWMILEDAHTSGDDGWSARGARLVERWELRRKAFAEEGIELPAVSLPTPSQRSAPSPTGLLGLGSRRSSGVGESQSCQIDLFARTIADIQFALHPPLESLVVVLAPTVVESPAQLERELELLLGQSELAACRFVLVLDADLPLPKGLLGDLGDSASNCDCVVSAQGFEDDLSALLGGEGARRLVSGAAPRGVVPPKRVDDPPEVSPEKRDELLREAGIEPAFLLEAPQLAALTVGAALAMKKGNGPEAVRLQREAKELCRRLGQQELEVICRVALASYLSGLERRDLAIEELEGTAAFAATHEMYRQQAQVLFALGLVQALDKKPPEAACNYVRAARTAEEAGDALLAIEGFRLAAQLALGLRAEPQAMACLQEALRVAETSDVEAVQGSGAAEAARQLAGLARGNGLTAQAALLEDQAERMDRGEYGLGSATRTTVVDMDDLLRGHSLEEELLEVLTQMAIDVETASSPGPDIAPAQVPAESREREIPKTMELGAAPMPKRLAVARKIVMSFPTSSDGGEDGSSATEIFDEESGPTKTVLLDEEE